MEGEKKPLTAKFYGDENGKIEIANEEQLKDILKKIK